MRPSALLIPLFLSATVLAHAAEERPLQGFTPEHAARQRALEARFDGQLRRENLREWMERLTLRPHHVGSPGSKENAEWIAAQLRSWGYETGIEEFQVLFPTPKTRLLQMTAPTHFTARLAEPVVKGDRSSTRVKEGLPVFNAYSCDGDVTAPVVYVNYGIPKDYEVLAERGIEVKGKIVLARYGGSWRGIKPKVAAEHGAVGCLIYSDPKDDGYFAGDVYPRGAFRNEHGAQRGSVADLPLYSGDPLTPGIGATKDAKRLSLKEAPTLTKIPVLPISYADALPFLKAMDGPVAPEEWRGALPLTYHLGPGKTTAHLKVAFDWKLVPCYDVIARLRGAERPDEWVIRGNHHDAWVFGADDPTSGTVAELEEARAVAQLAKSGWRPKRTMIYAFWDGEEPGLLGSTEWVETHAEELNHHAAVYVNSDNSGRGFLRAGGSHTLEAMVGEVAAEVTDPQKGMPVGERLRAMQLLRGTAEEKKAAREHRFQIGALGSGSDYTPFLQHLGVASLDLRYGGENAGGSYHSNYDSFEHYLRFGDPDFSYGVALAQTAGRVMLRCAEADVLPFELSHLSETVSRYATEVEKLADTMRTETTERNQLIRDGILAAAADPKQPFVQPQPLSPVPNLDFGPLKEVVARLQASVKAYEAAQKEHPGPTLSPEAQRRLDEALIRTERDLVRDAGLPRRPWYRHQLYAPGFYTGYGVKTLPGVREAIEERRWDEAQVQIGVAAETLRALAGEVDHAARLLTGDAS